MRKILSLFLFFSILIQIISPFFIFKAIASWLNIYQQNINLWTSYSDNFDSSWDWWFFSVNPWVDFRYDSFLENTSWWDISWIIYHASFPEWIIYNTTTLAQIPEKSNYIIPTTEFYPNTLSTYSDLSYILWDWGIFRMRRIILKFPTTWSTYENVFSNYFTNWAWSISSNTIHSTIYVNVKPHITDYYFEKSDGSTTTSQVQWSEVESINLVLKVKDHNWCTNIAWGSVKADLSQLGLSNSETLSYQSCDADWKTAIFKKTWITTNSSVWTYNFTSSSFSATDVDWNINDVNDVRFWAEDKKTTLSLNVVVASAPQVTLISLNNQLIWWPEKTSYTLSFSWNQIWEYKVALWSDWSCGWWTDLSSWWVTYWTANSQVNFSVLSNTLLSWNNSVYACVKNSWWNIWSTNVNIIKDVTQPTISSVTIFPASITSNDSSVSFSCSEDWFYRVEIWWNWTPWSWTIIKDWTAAIASTSYSTTLPNSNFAIWSNTVYSYCKDIATNFSNKSWTITKEEPTPSMSWKVTSFTDCDSDTEGLTWKDFCLNWNNDTAIPFTWFWSYRIYVLPSTTTFNSSTQTHVASVIDKNTTSWNWTSAITTDSLWNALTTWSYKVCIAIMWLSLQLWEAWCSSSVSMVADTVAHPTVLSAKFTSDTNLEITTDATLSTTPSDHNASLISFTYNSQSKVWTSISSINWKKINVTIPSLWNNAWAVWTNLVVWTWAIRASVWWYNNNQTFASITDGQAPTITWFANNTTSFYSNFFSWSITLAYTTNEVLQWWWSTRVEFVKTAWNTSTTKVFNITTASNLLSWSHTQVIDLKALWLVDWTTYSANFITNDSAWNTATTQTISNIKFDSVWPSASTLTTLDITSNPTPTFTWSASSDNSWNWSWVKEYTLKIFNWNVCSWTAVQTYTVTTTSKAITSSLANWTYSWNITPKDNMNNVWTTSSCDDFVVDINIPEVQNISIKDTVINSTSYTKIGRLVDVSATIANTNKSNVTANLTSLLWAWYDSVNCATPLSGVTCAQAGNIYTFSFQVWASITEWVKQVRFIANNTSWVNTQTWNWMSITVDNTNPTSWTISSPASLSVIWWTSYNIAWSWISDSNLNYLKFEYSSNGWWAYNLIWTWANSSPHSWNITSLTSWSNYKLKITAVDRAWNESITESWIFSVDKDWPTITQPLFTNLSSASFVKWNNTFVLNWTNWNITDNLWLSSTPISFSYSTNWTDWTSIASNLSNNWSYSWAVPSINSSTVKLRITVADNVWNTTTYTTDNFVVDSTNPTFTMWVSTPPNISYVNAGWFNIEWVASDTNLTSISYTFKRVSDNYYWNWTSYVWTEYWNTLQDNISWISYNVNSPVTPLVTQWATYDLVVRALDKAWNQILTTSRRYTWDTQAPIVNITTSSWTYFKDTITISWTSSDVWAWVSSVSVSIKKWSQYWDWSSWVASSTLLWTSTSNNYWNWTYLFNPPSWDTTWQVYEITAIAYDSSYISQHNSTTTTSNIILDETNPVIDNNIFTFNTSNIYAWGDSLNITWNTSWISDSMSWLWTNPVRLDFYDWSSWNLIADNLANNWTYNYTLPNVDSLTLVRITVSDKVWNTSFQNSNDIKVDSTPPHIVSVETMDRDTDWQIDAFLVTMSEKIKDSTIDKNNFTIWSWIWTPASWLAWWMDPDDETFILTFSNTWTTATTPTLSYVKWTLTDLAWKKLETVSNISSTDKAVPRILKAEAFDTNANWKLDKVEVTFSENMSSTTTNSFNINNDIVISSVSVSSNVASLILEEGSNYDTSTNGLLLWFTSNTNWKDLNDNNLNTISSLSIVDKAKPILVSWILKDTDSDYLADKILLSFSENITWTLGWFTLSSWTVWTVTASWSTDLVLSGSWISWTHPSITLSYSWNLSDWNSNNLDNISSFSLQEKISPKLVSAVTLDQNFNWKMDAVNLHFSENITWAFWDFSVSVNSFSSPLSYSFSWTTDVIVFLEEKQLIDTTLTPLVTISSNTTVKDSNANILTSWQSVTSADWVWPVIIWARFDEWTNNLYLNFSENVTNSLNNSSFVLNGATATISSTNFTPWNNTAVLTLSNNGITYWTSEVSFNTNIASDSNWNKQWWTYFTKISASVLINEYMDDSNLKYIELKNISSSPVNIGWWIIENALSSTWIVLSSYSIPANSYYLIATSNYSSYFSGSVTVNQTANLDISWNLVLKNWIINVDSALHQTWNAKTSFERLETCSDSLSASCWYEWVSSDLFSDNTYKWTPWSQNIFDDIAPTILSSNPENNKIYPKVSNINVNFTYEDDVSWVWVDTSSINLLVQKFDGSSWLAYNTAVITPWSKTTSSSDFALSWFNSYWRYRLVFSVSDLAWNEVIQNVDFYIDEFKFNINYDKLNLWVLQPSTQKLADDIVEITVQTIWAPFQLNHSITNPSNFWNWDWINWYWACIWDACTTLESFASKQVANQAKDLQTSWNLKTYSYKVRYWALIDSFQEAWVYDFINKNEVIINY